MLELKPCPFCGESVRNLSKCVFLCRDMAAIRCDLCNALGPCIVYDLDDFAKGLSDPYSFAASNWNKRVGDA